MFTRVLLFSTLIIGLYSYNSRQPAKGVKIWQKPSQDSLSKIDSLKWIMYIMNYYKKFTISDIIICLNLVFWNVTYNIMARLIIKRTLPFIHFIFSRIALQIFIPLTIFILAG